ncbi:hypothetical protein [Persephonella sp.]
MSEIHSLIFKYIIDYDSKGEEIVKNIFRKTLNKSAFDSLITSSDSFDDLYNEFYIKKIIPQRDKFRKIFENDYTGLIKYLKTTIHNFLSDLRDKKKIEELSITIEDENSGKKVPLVETVGSNEIFNIIQYIEASEITEKIKKFLSEEDQKVLCYIVFKDKYHKNYCLENLRADTIYKRVERLKKEKLKKFVETYGVTEEGFRLFLKEYLMSEICNKLC